MYTVAFSSSHPAVAGQPGTNSQFPLLLTPVSRPSSINRSGVVERRMASVYTSTGDRGAVGDRARVTAWTPRPGAGTFYWRLLARPRLLLRPLRTLLRQQT